MAFVRRFQTSPVSFLRYGTCILKTLSIRLKPPVLVIVFPPPLKISDYKFENCNWNCPSQFTECHFGFMPRERWRSDKDLSRRSLTHNRLDLALQTTRPVPNFYGFGQCWQIEARPEDSVSEWLPLSAPASRLQTLMTLKKTLKITVERKEGSRSFNNYSSIPGRCLMGYQN